MLSDTHSAHFSQQVEARNQEISSNCTALNSKFRNFDNWLMEEIAGNIGGIWKF